MSVPDSERHGRLSRLHKISAAGAAAVGVTAIAFTVVPGQKSSGSVTAGSEMAAKPVALQTAADSPAKQKVSIDAQTSAANDRARAHAKAEARKKAEARAKARHEAAKKAERDRERRLAASRSAERSKAAAPSGSPKEIARQIIGDASQFRCFSQIVERESGWDVHAQNPSGAYGLVQALPGSKMASAGPDWRNNAATQVKWGLNYMKDRYGSPCGAWSFWQSNNWY